MTGQPNLDIRRLVDMDAEDFYALRTRGLTLSPESFGEDISEFSARSAAEITRRFSSAGGSFVVGAFCPGLTGCVGLLRNSAVKTNHKATIWGLYVDRSHRGTGIGRRLMSYAIANAKIISGLEELVLAVVTTNSDAIKLYYSLGFQPYGTEPRALKLSDKYCDELLMRLPLHGK